MKITINSDLMQEWALIRIPRNEEANLVRIFRNATISGAAAFNSVLVRSKTDENDHAVYFLGWSKPIRNAIGLILMCYPWERTSAPAKGSVEFVAGNFHFGGVVE